MVDQAEIFFVEEYKQIHEEERVLVVDSLVGGGKADEDCEVGGGGRWFTNTGVCVLASHVA